MNNEMRTVAQVSAEIRLLVPPKEWGCDPDMTLIEIQIGDTTLEITPHFATDMEMHIFIRNLASALKDHTPTKGEILSNAAKQFGFDVIDAAPADTSPVDMRGVPHDEHD